MGWIKFGLLMAAQILLIGFMSDFVPESPALLISAAIWYFCVGFIVVLSGIAWAKEARKSGERSPNFTIVLSRKRIGISLITPAALLLVAVVIPDVFAIPLALLTIILGSVAGTILLDRVNSLPYYNHARSSHRAGIRTGTCVAIPLPLFVLIAGWMWAHAMDNRVESFFGRGSVLSELANESLGFPRYGLINDPRYAVWRVTSINYSNNEYCARLQFYTWMRISTHRWTSCFGIVLSDARFHPEAIEAGIGADKTNGIRPQFRHFRARGTSSSRTEIREAAWRNGTLTLRITPYYSLDGLVLEFIDNGDVILALSPSEATADKEAGTLTWAVEKQPWEAGDFLTFRIRAQRLPPAPL